MKDPKGSTISITGVLIEDPETKGYTAYFAELPEVIAQGSNKEEAKANLFDALKTILDFKREEMHDEDQEDDGIITTESFNLAVS
jgi:predicted RNase H-like HicB family nuclease